MVSMSIQIRTIANDSLVALTPTLVGLHIQTSFTDIRGRLVSGTFHSAKVLDDGNIAITLARYLNGDHVMDSALVSSGRDPLGRPWDSDVHIPSDHPLLAILETRGKVAGPASLAA
jgi:hypothetical protein